MVVLAIASFAAKKQKKKVIVLVLCEWGRQLTAATKGLMIHFK